MLRPQVLEERPASALALSCWCGGARGLGVVPLRGRCWCSAATGLRLFGPLLGRAVHLHQVPPVLLQQLLLRALGLGLIGRPAARVLQRFRPGCHLLSRGDLVPEHVDQLALAFVGHLEAGEPERHVSVAHRTAAAGPGRLGLGCILASGLRDRGRRLGNGFAHGLAEDGPGEVRPRAPLGHLHLLRFHEAVEV